MKLLRTVSLIFATVGVLSALSLVSFAREQESMNDTLINKFTAVYVKIPNNDPARVGLGLRLADLHSERAKEKSQNDLAAGKADREKALRYYRDSVEKAEATARPNVYIQMGHLYELGNDTAKANQAYTMVIGNRDANPTQLAEAHFSLGEMAFRSKNYPVAQKHYLNVMENPQASSRGLAAYRAAWCDFHAGRTENGIQGLVKILKTPDLAKRSGSGPGVVDAQFQEEVSRDLATFIAKRRVQKGDMKMMADLSPESSKLSNLVFLANEAERLGQSKEALEIWDFVLGVQKEAKDRLESQTHVAQLQLNLGQQKQAVESYEKALVLWESVGAKCGAACAEIKTRIKNFLVEWNKAEKKNPSAELLEGYKLYNKTFPEDSVMNLYMAQVARERKDYETAYNVFTELGKTPGEGQEPALLSAIETAELSKNKNWVKEATENYLARSTKKTQVQQIAYQQAKSKYDEGNYQVAAEELRAYALGKGPANLREQAANLSLDALGLLKDDERIQQWSAQYAKVFPGMANAAKTVARKAMMNQVASNSEKGDLEAAWATLSKDQFRDASPEDRALYLKNKLIIAEKRKDFSTARNISDEIIQLSQTTKAVTPADYQYALARKAWLAELVLDFDGALVATEKLQTKEDPEKRLLKLALYADLAQKDSRPYYMEYLKVAKNVDMKTQIATQLVRGSKDMAKEIEIQKPYLVRSPELLAQLYVEAYAKTKSPDVLKRALATKEVQTAKSGAILRRQGTLAQWNAFAKEIRDHKIVSSSQAKLAAGLKGRMKLIEQGEKLTNDVIKSGDWTGQVLFLTLQAEQEDRFYQEVMSLPVPAGLDANQEQEYMAALSQQAAPHQTKAQDLKNKVNEFWGEASAISQLEESLNEKNPQIRELVAHEIQMLVGVAPDSAKAQLTTALNRKPVAPRLPSPQEIEMARQNVRKDPMNASPIEKLLELEEKQGRPAMVGYLKSRLESLENKN